MHPFHSESDRNYHAFVGLYVGCWAGFEHGLYQLIRTVSTILRMPTPARAIPLSVKLKTIREAFSSNAELADEQPEAFALCDFAEAEAEFRHNLIHGVNAEIYKRDPWYTLMWRPEKSGGKLDQGDVLHVTEEDLDDHYQKVGMAGLATCGLISRLLDKVDSKLQQLESRGDAG